VVAIGDERAERLFRTHRFDGCIYVTDLLEFRVEEVCIVVWLGLSCVFFLKVHDPFIWSWERMRTERGKWVIAIGHGLAGAHSGWDTTPTVRSAGIFFSSSVLHESIAEGPRKGFMRGTVDDERPDLLAVGGVSEDFVGFRVGVDTFNSFTPAVECIDVW
jgi:hypothetical protein